MQTIKLKIVTTPCTSWTRHTKRSMNTFYYLGSICRKQILTDEYLVILNCLSYWSSIQNKTPHTFVRSINNSCRNSFYSMYCMDVASTELSSLIYLGLINIYFNPKLGQFIKLKIIPYLCKMNPGLNIHPDLTLVNVRLEFVTVRTVDFWTYILPWHAFNTYWFCFDITMCCWADIKNKTFFYLSIRTSLNIFRYRAN